MRRSVYLLFLGIPLLMAAEVREVAHREGANIQRPVLSEGAKQLAYEANFHDQKRIELFVGDLSSHQFAQVRPQQRGSSSITHGFNTDNKKGQVAQEIAFSPANINAYVYSASSDALDYDLYIKGAGALAAAPGTDGGPAWSPNGRFIAFTSSRTGQGDVYLLSVESIELSPKRLTSNPQESELYLSWAPDSSRLVYVAHGKTGDNLWTLGLDGTSVQLTTAGGSQTRPQFSPTMDRVAYYASENGKSFDLYVVDAEPGKTGATPKKMAVNVVPNAMGPAWTPSGDHLVFTQNDDSRFDPIAVVRVDKPEAMKVLALPTVGHGDLDVAQSADGKTWIAYVAQGMRSDKERDYKRLYLAELTTLP